MSEVKLVEYVLELSYADDNYIVITSHNGEPLMAQREVDGEYAFVSLKNWPKAFSEVVEQEWLAAGVESVRKDNLVKAFLARSKAGY